jgi:hypothetical protein
MFRFLLGMIVMVAIAAFATKPGPEAAQDELRRQVQLTVTSEKLDGKSGLDAAALLLCRADPTGCTDLVVSGIDLTYEDRYLYARIDIDGFNLRATCYGMFTRFYCPGGLQRI